MAKMHGFVETVYNGLEVCIGFRFGGCMYGVYGWKVDSGLGMVHLLEVGRRRGILSRGFEELYE